MKPHSRSASASPFSWVTPELVKRLRKMGVTAVADGSLSLTLSPKSVAVKTPLFVEASEEVVDKETARLEKKRRAYFDLFNATLPDAELERLPDLPSSS